MLRTLTAVLSLLLVNGLRADDWPVFRGNAAQDGLRAGTAPKKLELLWKASTKDSIEGAPAIAAGAVYVGSYDNFLHAYDLQTGTEKWASKIGPVKSSPAVRGNRVIAGDVDGKVHCLDIKDGREIWNFETGAEITGGANFYKDLILIGSHDETLYCLGGDGKKKWEFKANGPVNGVPAVVGNRTFVAGCDNNLHIVEIETGRELKTIDLGGPSGATAAIADGHLYVGTMNNEILSVDLKAEDVAWRFAAPRRQQPFYSSASVTNALVIVGSRDKKLYALDRVTGKEKWNFATEGKVDSSPLVVGDRIYFGSMDKILYALDMKGTEVQQIPLDGPIIGSPAFAEGRLVIGTEKGTVYCFGAK